MTSHQGINYTFHFLETWKRSQVSENTTSSITVGSRSTKTALQIKDLLRIFLTLASIFQKQGHKNTHDKTTFLTEAHVFLQRFRRRKCWNWTKESYWSRLDSYWSWNTCHRPPRSCHHWASDRPGGSHVRGSTVPCWSRCQSVLREYYKCSVAWIHCQWEYIISLPSLLLFFNDTFERQPTRLVHSVLGARNDIWMPSD